MFLRIVYKFLSKTLIFPLVCVIDNVIDFFSPSAYQFPDMFVPSDYVPLKLDVAKLIKYADVPL